VSFAKTSHKKTAAKPSRAETILVPAERCQGWGESGGGEEQEKKDQRQKKKKKSGGSQEKSDIANASLYKRS